jgi:hypothetical protein
MKIDRNKVYAKYDGHCAYCGIGMTFKQMHVDHVRPKIFGGTDDFINLNPSCKECNNYKCHWHLEEFREALKDLLGRKINYLFKSKTKMQVAINMGAIEVKEWDGKFYFETIKNKTNGRAKMEVQQG